MRRLTRVVLVLLITTVPFATPLLAQDAGSGTQETGGFTLEQNYPNPFNPETKIPFVLNEELFRSGRPVVVSMRIFNLIRQPVAVPQALEHPMGLGVPLVQLEYDRPGRHEAYWDGKDFSGATVASGVYWVQLTVNGVSKARKIIVTK
jgi:hypothetical protein